MIRVNTIKHDFGELGSIRIDICVEAKGHSISLTRQEYGVFNDSQGQFTYNVVKELSLDRTIVTSLKSS
jgi:hypothetical protein